MGYFYFDESIHKEGNFILGAFVYADSDLSAAVDSAIHSVGLVPRVDEFKSSIRKRESSQQLELRNRLKILTRKTRLGLVVLPYSERSYLGREALRCLRKIIAINGLADENHKVFIDQGIQISNLSELSKEFSLQNSELLLEQDSRHIGGLQIADLAAHSMSIMLKETLGLIKKTTKAGPNSRYDSDVDIEIGFELWTTMRYCFFTKDTIDIDNPDIISGFTVDTGKYAVHIAKSCPKELSSAVTERFGSNYLGCIH